MLQSLPHVNAMLNALATALLIAGFVLIQRRRESAHRWVMLAACGTSIAFLVSYLTYHVGIGGGRRFPTDAAPIVRGFYLTILLTHSLLAATVPFLATGTVYLGLTNRRAAHRRLAKWTLPIWLYVSLTGIVVYVMLYHVYAGGSG